jgi:molybdenum cofactor cytidylyltransferase
MNLAYALNIRPGDIVAFVGAGGKTQAMFRLASDLVDQGLRVITTTTMVTSEDDLRRAPQRVGFGHGMMLPETLPHQVEQHRHVFVFVKLEKDGKVRGVRPAWLDEHLAPAPYKDVLLVEADGSRRLPLKAPLPHEPAIPDSATIVVPVVGLDVLGQPLDEAHVYGAERVQQLTGHPLGQPVTPRAMAAVLMHPELGLKAVPPEARILPLLNKATAETLSQAREIAGYLLTDSHIEAALIGAVQEPDPIWETRRRVGAIILAAGESKRMGYPKMLLPWGQVSVIRHVCQQVLACGLFEVVVVIGDRADAVRAQIEDLPVRIVFNPRYAQDEMLSSLQVGLAEIWHSCDACLVVLGDQALLTPEVIQAIPQAYFAGYGEIVTPTYEGQQGHPVLIDKHYWQELMALPPGSAPRDMLRKRRNLIYQVVMGTDAVVRDLDTPEDYQQARREAT